MAAMAACEVEADGNNGDDERTGTRGGYGVRRSGNTETDAGRSGASRVRGSGGGRSGDKGIPGLFNGGFNHSTVMPSSEV